MEMYLDEILAMPGCERLREWCAIGPVQRAAFEEAATLLAAQTMTREREQSRSLVERYQAEAQSCREAYHQLLEQMAAAKAGEREACLQIADQCADADMHASMAANAIRARA